MVAPVLWSHERCTARGTSSQKGKCQHILGDLKNEEGAAADIEAMSMNVDADSNT